MPTVLVVEDRPTDRELLVSLLGGSGYDVLETGEGRGCAAPDVGNGSPTWSSRTCWCRRWTASISREPCAPIPSIAGTPIILYTAASSLGAGAVGARRRRVARRPQAHGPEGNPWGRDVAARGERDRLNDRSYGPSGRRRPRVPRGAHGGCRSAPSLELWASPRTRSDAVELSRLHQPDVAVVDVTIAGRRGPARRAGAPGRSPADHGARAVGAWRRGDLMHMLYAGAAGYLLKGISAAELVDAIERTADRRSVISAETSASSAWSPRALHRGRRRRGQGGARRARLDHRPRPDFALVGKARDATAATRLAALYTPDLALVDASMPGGGGERPPRSSASARPPRT